MIYLLLVMAAVWQAVARIAVMLHLCAQTELLVWGKWRVSCSKCHTTRIRDLKTQINQVKMGSKRDACLCINRMRDLLYVHHLWGRTESGRVQRRQRVVVSQHAGLATSVHGCWGVRPQDRWVCNWGLCASSQTVWCGLPALVLYRGLESCSVKGIMSRHETQNFWICHILGGKAACWYHLRSSSEFPRSEPHHWTKLAVFLEMMHAWWNALYCRQFPWRSGPDNMAPLQRAPPLPSSWPTKHKLLVLKIKKKVNKNLSHMYKNNLSLLPWCCF